MDIQTVLAATGIPTYAGAWQPLTEGAVPPAQYIVHNYARAPDQSADDGVTAYATYAYVTMWSDTNTDPAASILLVRAAALAAGWGTVDERTLYDSETKSHGIAWTFVGWDDVG